MNKKLLYPLIFIACFAADRLSKAWAFVSLMTQDIQLFPGLSFELAWNRGISYGMLQFNSDTYFWFLTAGIMLVTTILAIHALCMMRNGEQIVGELLVLSGACSNLIDRFMYGAVLDFIDLYVGPWHWYTFNLADAWVVIGVGVMMYKYFVQDRGIS